MKVTPAHDPNDFEIGQRHQLENIIVMDEYGKMNDKADKYKGWIDLIVEISLLKT